MDVKACSTPRQVERFEARRTEQQSARPLGTLVRCAAQRHAATPSLRPLSPPPAHSRPVGAVAAYQAGAKNRPGGSGSARRRGAPRRTRSSTLPTLARHGGQDAVESPEICPMLSGVLDLLLSGQAVGDVKPSRAQTSPSAPKCRAVKVAEAPVVESGAAPAERVGLETHLRETQSTAEIGKQRTKLSMA